MADAEMAQKTNNEDFVCYKMLCLKKNSLLKVHQRSIQQTENDHYFIWYVRKMLMYNIKSLMIWLVKLKVFIMYQTKRFIGSTIWLKKRLVPTWSEVEWTGLLSNLTFPSQIKETFPDSEIEGFFGNLNKEQL